MDFKRAGAKARKATLNTVNIQYNLDLFNSTLAPASRRIVRASRATAPDSYVNNNDISMTTAASAC